MDKITSRTKSALREVMERAVDDYEQSDDYQKWSSLVFVVARQMRGHPVLSKCDGWTAWSVVQQIVDWEDLAEDECVTEEDVAVAYASAHDAVKFLPGETLLSAAAREAEQQPLTPPQPRSKGYKKFLAMVAACARKMQSAQIAIPIEAWGEALHVRPATVSSYRKWAVEDGLLVLTHEYSLAARRANIYDVKFHIKGKT